MESEGRTEALGAKGEPLQLPGCVAGRVAPLFLCAISSGREPAGPAALAGMLTTGSPREGAPGDCHQSPTRQGQLIQLRRPLENVWANCSPGRGQSRERN